MALPSYASPLERLWHYGYRIICALIFLYLLAAILILGAEFNGALIRQHLPGEDEPGPDPLAPDQDNSD